jgi:hypothetical protein
MTDPIHRSPELGKLGLARCLATVKYALRKM